MKVTYKIPQLTTEKGVFNIEKYIESKGFLTVQRHFKLTNFKFQIIRESPCQKTIRNYAVT